MSKGGSLLCALVLLLVCIVVRLFLLTGSPLGGAQIGDVFLCQDPIRRSSLMLNRGRDGFGNGGNADSSSDDELADEGMLAGDEYVSDDEDVSSLLAGGEADAEEEEGLLLLDGDDDGDDDGARAKDNSSGEHGSGGDVECPECGKFFKNDKSMFGHLRSHPNRGYKGATPPVKRPKLSPETDAESPGTLSAGNDRPLTRHSQRDPNLTPFETFCARVMLTLRYRDSQAVQQVPAPQHSVSEVQFDAIEHTEGGIGLVTSNAAAGVKNNAGPKVDNSVLCDDEHGGSAVKIPKKRRMNMSKEAREAQRKVKLVISTKEKRPYICKHCKAEFPTHQALGGHMFGHHREKKNLVLNEKETWQAHQGTAGQSQSGKQADGGDGSWRDGLSLLSRWLQVEQLPMALNMGQAAGGHMRQHFGRSDDVSSLVVAPPPADGDRRRLLNIDLNVEAPEQD